MSENTETGVPPSYDEVVTASKFVRARDISCVACHGRALAVTDVDGVCNDVTVSQDARGTTFKTRRLPVLALYCTHCGHVMFFLREVVLKVVGPEPAAAQTSPGPDREPQE